MFLWGRGGGVVGGCMGIRHKNETSFPVILTYRSLDRKSNSIYSLAVSYI